MTGSITVRAAGRGRPKLPLELRRWRRHEAPPSERSAIAAGAPARAAPGQNRHQAGIGPGAADRGVEIFAVDRVAGSEHQADRLNPGAASIGPSVCADARERDGQGRSRRSRCLLRCNAGRPRRSPARFQSATGCRAAVGRSPRRDGRRARRADSAEGRIPNRRRTMSWLGGVFCVTARQPTRHASGIVVIRRPEPLPRLRFLTECEPDRLPRTSMVFGCRELLIAFLDIAVSRLRHLSRSGRLRARIQLTLRVVSLRPTNRGVAS